MIVHNISAEEHNRNLITYAAALQVFESKLSQSARELFLGINRIELHNLSNIAQNAFSQDYKTTLQLDFFNKNDTSIDGVFGVDFRNVAKENERYLGRRAIYRRGPSGRDSIPLLELEKATKELCEHAYNETRRDSLGARVEIQFGGISEDYNPSQGASATVRIPVTLSIN